MVSSKKYIHTLTIDEVVYKYQIIYKKTARLRLKLDSQSNFTVIASRLIPNFLVNNFIQKNLSWIKKNTSKLPHYPSLNLDSKISILDKIITVNSIVSNIDDIKNELKKMALVLISDELEILCQKHVFTYNKLSLKNQKTRFGSCSSKNNLNFNWQCIFFPKNIFQHLLLHELVHTKIKNHQKEFWAQLTLCDPDTKNNNAWLKNFGARHFLFSP